LVGREVPRANVCSSAGPTGHLSKELLVTATASAETPTAAPTVERPMTTSLRQRLQPWSRRTRSHRTARRLASVAVAAAVVIPIAGASAAQAVTMDRVGAPGTYTTYQASCESRLFANSRVVSMSAPPPRVFARNNRAGAGNDWSWVRYRAMVRNESTGALVVASGYSGWSYATDVSPATWSGWDSFQVAGSSVPYRILYIIEWWNSTTQTGAVSDSLQSYRLTDQTSISRSTWHSCTYLSGMY
jgi:hypothetical protein